MSSTLNDTKGECKLPQKEDKGVAKSNIEQGVIVFRKWDENTGLTETIQEFATLEDLFRLCLEATDPLLVDRVQIRGTDASGESRKLTLVFQSITISEGQV